ncbi:MAG: helix-turn-helix domain-containing protein, partial [Acidimicrobiales bacterium]
GLAPKQVDQLRRARRAHRLLLDGTTVADAAVAAGYSDQAHLTRAFRRLGDMTPARIRHQAVDSFSSRP